MDEFEANATVSGSSQPQIEMLCTVTGPAKHRGALTDKAVCERFGLRIREALKQPVKQTALIPASSKARWVKLQIKLLPLGRAEAALTSRLHGKATNHPLLAVQVMDKPLGLGEIDKLARLAGQTLAAS